ncbi:MAG: glutamine--tRNA ligase/YqeY domain fusion protein [Verrucomicrobiae bacterium]|nr:glutamine--tRNA ligase/YqeY domain fusion protein [Verrucomicrobiae bacterium]
MNPSEPSASLDFIRQIIEQDRSAGKNGGRVHTRFPPEPNGYLHIGHAKSICLNFGLAKRYQGKCNLRFDDTNPTREDVEYVESIQEDVRWLGFDWENRMFFASDYFEKLYQFAVQLIQKGKAYVCDLTAEQFKSDRGTPTSPGRESPHRNRSIEENLDLFRRMRAGEFADGARTLRARIDMASPNIHMRDPALYRIRHATHHRTGGQWCIYPTYDYAHCISDALESITHSICTLEFEVHRPLYDWILDQLDGLPCHPQQIEFARLNLTYTVMSKRKLLQLVEEKQVRGWDDPRMPTIAGLRRRGYTPEAIREFCDRIGVAKRENVIDMALLDYCLRQDLEVRARRAMGILRPLKIVLTNYPEGQTEEFDIPNHPSDAAMGIRKVSFSRELYIEQEDFREDAPKKYFRLTPAQEVRLRSAYLIKCQKVIKDATGKITELQCTYDPATRGGNTPDGRKVKGTIHWVSAAHALPAEIRLYDRLFTKEDPDNESDGKDFKTHLNPNSLEVIQGFVEAGLRDAQPGSRFQFERLGYFCVDSMDSKPGHPVFNRTVSLRDSWAKIEKKG